MNKAIKWWESLSLEDKFYKTIIWLKLQDKDVTEIHPYDLTKKQIREIDYGSINNS